MVNLPITKRTGNEAQDKYPAPRDAAPLQQFAPRQPVRPAAASAAARAAPSAVAPASVAHSSRQKARSTLPQGAAAGSAPSRDLNARNDAAAKRTSDFDDVEFDAPFGSSVHEEGQDGGQEGSGDQEGEFGASESDGVHAASGEDALDMDSLADELLAKAADNGIFEVTLPNGQKLGVVVNAQSNLVRFHLSAADEKLGDRLRRRQMELQGRLERRIHKNVDITVL